MITDWMDANSGNKISKLIQHALLLRRLHKSSVLKPWIGFNTGKGQPSMVKLEITKIRTVRLYCSIICSPGSRNLIST